jgi:guanylate kinase
MKGLVIVLSGPAGSGKDTLLNRYFKFGSAKKTVSATTRPIRHNEIDGRDYHFFTRERFEKAITSGELLEYTEYAGNYYGTLISEINRITAAGHDVILKIEVEGGQNVKKRFPDAVMVFTFPPNADILAARLKNRGTEDEQTIKKRFTVAEKEIEIAEKVYDYLIINDDADDAAKQFADIITARHAAMSENIDFMNEVRDNVKNYII